MKKISSILLVFLLLFGFSVPAYAAEFAGEGNRDRVVDLAGILTDNEHAALSARADELSAQVECGISVVTVDNWRSYGIASQTDNIFDAGEALFDEYRLGWQGGEDGIVLLLSMSDRKYVMNTLGFAKASIGEYAETRIEEAFLGDFGQNRWFSGFSDFMGTSAELLQMARDGEPFTPKSDPALRPMALAVSFGIAAVVALLVGLFLRKQMKSVFVGAEASDYITEGSCNIALREDRYTHSTETRVKIEKQAGGGGSSSGRSGGSSGSF